MKTKTFFSLLAGSLFSLAAFGQTVQNTGGTVKAKEEITFATQIEKDTKVKQLQDKIKADSNDPSFPADVLKKEKQELANTKKAKLTGTKNESIKK